MTKKQKDLISRGMAHLLSVVKPKNKSVEYGLIVNDLGAIKVKIYPPISDADLICGIPKCKKK